MMQVQVFDEDHEDDLTEVINSFLGSHPTLQLYDIKFSTAMSFLSEDEQVYCFSALLIYQDKESEECAY